MFGDRGEEGRQAQPALGPDLRILDGIASWCGGLHGSMSLAEALGALATALGAEAAALGRHGRNDEKCRMVASYDARIDDGSVDAIRRCYAPDVLGEYYNKVKISTLWFMADHFDDESWSASTGLTNWCLQRGLGDAVVISLSSNAQNHDYIEFHFKKALTRIQKAEVANIVPTLVRSWAGRKTGLVTQSQMDDRMVRARARASEARLKPDAPILGTSNPAKLSRAEFRVCLLLSRGLSVKGVTDELGLSEATVRSHLRSIYSKTHTSGHAELLYRILSSTPETADRKSINF